MIKENFYHFQNTKCPNELRFNYYPLSKSGFVHLKCSHVDWDSVAVQLRTSTINITNDKKQNFLERKRENKNMAKTGKKELVAKLAAELETTKKHASEIVDAYEKVVKESIQEVGDKVQLVGFLTLEAKVRAARNGRNPQTGEAITIPEKVVVSSKAKFEI